MADPCAQYSDSDGCLITPECPAIITVPSSHRSIPVFGWNAGANSLQILDGDVFCRFQVPAHQVGTRIGLKQTRYPQALPNVLTHGFYFQRSLVDLFQVMEGGSVRTTLAERAADDVFEIRRVRGQVTYWRNGALVYTSDVMSYGPVLVGACLYASGDSLPSGPPKPPPDAGSPWWSNDTGYQDTFFPALGDFTSTIARTNPDDPYYLNPYYWVYQIPDGAGTMDVSVFSDSGAFEASGGWVSVSVGTPGLLSSNFGTTSFGANSSFAYIVPVDATLNPTINVALYANTGFDDVNLNVTFNP